MKTDADIYRMLVRTAGMARRMPVGEDREDAPRKWHGYGHILDTLVSGEVMSQQQVAAAFGIRTQSLSGGLSVMETRGLVRREPCAKDKRVMLVYLTEQGVARREEMSEQREYKASRFLSCLDEEEKEMLYRLLEKLSDNHRREENV